MEKIRQFFRKMYEYFLKFVAKLDGIGKDKYMHFIAGAVITGCAALFPCFAPYSWMAGALAGVLKECIDKARGGKWDASDCYATVLGAIICQGFLWVYLLIW